MNEKTIARYSFLPWLRQGIATMIKEIDNLGIDDSDQGERAKVKISLDIKATDLGSKEKSESISKEINLYGPGDITGIDSRAVVRTDPRHWITDFEPNYFPLIEFYDEDFPWRFTPALANDEHRLRPWICLVVLTEEEFKQGEQETLNLNNDSAQKLQRIIVKKVTRFTLTERSLLRLESEEVTTEILEKLNEIKNKSIEGETKFIDVLKKTIGDEQTALYEIKILEHAEKDHSLPPLPQPTETWAWAHVHVNRDLGNNKGDDINQAIANLKEYLQQNPDLAISRLICPRKLQSNTAYHAFVVPTFETGRLAGLDMEIPNEIDGLVPAWNLEQDNVELPVYYRWYFRTGERGDFEYLVRLIEPRVLVNEIGIRDLDVQNPGSEVTGLEDTKLVGLEGALKTLQTNPRPWQNPLPYNEYSTKLKDIPDKFQDSLSKLINLSETLLEEESTEDPIIIPPLYGRWHAAVKKLRNPGNPPWIEQLSLDPRNRTVAGFGTSVVQKQQEDLMSSAWEQVKAVLEANRQLLQGQLAREVSLSLFGKNLAALETDQLFSVTGPVQSRVLGSPTTIKQLMKKSTLPLASVSRAFRRIVRSGGPLSIRINQQKKKKTSRFLSRLNRKEITAALPKTASKKQISLNNISDRLFPSWIPNWLKPYLKYSHWFVLVIFILLILLNFIFNFVLFRSHSFILILGVMTIIIYYLLLKSNRWEAGSIIRESKLTPSLIKNIPPQPNFKLTKPGKTIPPNGKSEKNSQEEANFRKAAMDAHLRFQAKVPQPEKKQLLNFEAVKKSLLTELDPKTSIPKRILKIIIPASFKLTKESIERLRSERLPDYILESLNGSTNQVFVGHSNFLEILKSMIDKELKSMIEKNKSLILHSTFVKRYRLSKKSLKKLKTEEIPAEVIEQITSLPKKVFIEESFIKALKLKIETEQLEKYKSTILKYTLIDEGYMITDRSLKNLSSEGLPNEVIEALGSSSNQMIADKEEFLKFIRLEVNEKHFILYKSAILDQVSEIDLSDRDDPLAPIMAAPDFPQPMYEPLRQISPELLIPNLNLIPQNTIALLTTNQPFIESYMVGLNHEMGRELLWREYPTDQRGSYFRQFWDVSDFVNTEPELTPELLAEKLKDIKPIHTWRKETNLGDNNNRKFAKNKEYLVLTLRSDLLKKYPTAVIYATEAIWPEDGSSRTLGIEEKYPVFKAKIDPDLTFFGFELTAEEVKGLDNPEDEKPGWFFVIKERPGEPRFGLDIAVGNAIESKLIFSITKSDDLINNLNDRMLPDSLRLEFEKEDISLPIEVEIIVQQINIQWLIVIDEQSFRIQADEENLDIYGVVEHWDDLSWGHLAENSEDFDKLNYINLNKGLCKVDRDAAKSIDGVDWGTHAADMAHITYQDPVYIAVHASEMLV